MFESCDALADLEDMGSPSLSPIKGLDEYNSTIETFDPGQRENARLTDPLRSLLAKIFTNGDAICDGLLEVLKEQPA